LSLLDCCVTSLSSLLFTRQLSPSEKPEGFVLLSFDNSGSNYQVSVTEYEYGAPLWVSPFISLIQPHPLHFSPILCFVFHLSSCHSFPFPSSFLSLSSTISTFTCLASVHYHRTPDLEIDEPLTKTLEDE